MRRRANDGSLADVFAPGIPSITYAFIAYVLLWVAAALTVYTGVIYFRSGMRYLRPGVTPEQREQLGSRETA